MRKFAIAILLAAVPTLAHAGSVSAPLTVTINPAFAVAATPPAPVIECNNPAGTVVAAITVSGGNGKPVTLAMTGDTTDFALSGNSIVIGSSGLKSPDLACSAIPAGGGVTKVVTITASQPN